MDNRVLRIVLFVTALLFIFGMSWAIYTVARRGNNTTVEQPVNKAPADNQKTAKKTPAKPAKKKTTAKLKTPAIQRNQPNQTVIYYYVTETFESEASASASALADSSTGSVHAEAHAE